MPLDNVVLYPPPAPAAVVITMNTGGYVDEYFAAAERFKRTGQRIEVRGECRSACTVLLEVPTLCVAPGAVFRWHHAYVKSTGQLKPEITDQMLSRLPYRISSRLVGRIQKSYTPQASLDYKELVSLGVPACKGHTTVASDARPRPRPLNPLQAIFRIFR